MANSCNGRQGRAGRPPTCDSAYEWLLADAVLAPLVGTRGHRTVRESLRRAQQSARAGLIEPGRDGAWVAELTDLLDLKDWPTGMRVIARKERLHPGAQLRLTDIDGLRVTAFATNTSRGQLPDLELRHRRRARAELG